MSKAPAPAELLKHRLEIGHRIRVSRKKLGLTQYQLANAMGLNPATYNRYEFGKHSITLGILAFFAEKLKVSIDYLLTGKETLPEIEISITQTTPCERYYINRYRRLDERGQSLMDTVMNHEYQLSQGTEEGSNGIGKEEI